MSFGWWVNWDTKVKLPGKTQEGLIFLRNILLYQNILFRVAPSWFFHGRNFGCTTVHNTCSYSLFSPCISPFFGVWKMSSPTELGVALVNSWREFSSDKMMNLNSSINFHEIWPVKVTNLSQSEWQGETQTFVFRSEINVTYTTLVPKGSKVNFYWFSSPGQAQLHLFWVNFGM